MSLYILLYVSWVHEELKTENGFEICMQKEKWALLQKIVDIERALGLFKSWLLYKDYPALYTVGFSIQLYAYVQHEFLLVY